MWFPPVSVSMSRVFCMIIFTIIMINSSSKPGSCSGHGYSLLKSVELSEFSWSLITAPLLQCLALSLSIVQHTDKTVAPLPRPRGWQLFPVQHGDHVDISSCSSHTSSPAANDHTIGYQTSESASSSRFHHLVLLALLVAVLVSHSSNFHHQPLLACLWR